MAFTPRPTDRRSTCTGGLRIEHLLAPTDRESSLRDDLEQTLSSLTILDVTGNTRVDRIQQTYSCLIASASLDSPLWQYLTSEPRWA